MSSRPPRTTPGDATTSHIEGGGGELLGLSLRRHSLALRCGESYPMLSGYVKLTYQKVKAKCVKLNSQDYKQKSKMSVTK